MRCSSTNPTSGSIANTFERLRAGDCEDFAIWAWRQLVELRYDADLVAGYCLINGALAGRHVWVLLRENDGVSLFEPVAREPNRMIRPLSEVRDRYLPEFGVDRAGKAGSRSTVRFSRRK